MKNHFGSLFASLALFASVAQAQIPPPHDDCSGALPITLAGALADTSQATSSGTPWPCGNGGADVWYSYVASRDDDLEFSTCSFSSTFDTILEVFSGDCTTLVSLACNDDCVPFGWSSVRIQGVVAGTKYHVRVGGKGGATGFADLSINETFPLSPECLQTSFDSQTVGAAGGAVYFDLKASQTVALDRLALDFDEPAGTPVNLEIWTRAGSYAGSTGSAAGWSLTAVSVGGAVCAGPGNDTWVDVTPRAFFGTSTRGVAVVARTTSHRYSQIAQSGLVERTGDGVLRLTAGAANDVPFSAGTLYQSAPTLIICYDIVGVGGSYCATRINSTGSTGVLVALGSAVAADNDVTLMAARLPASAFGFFLASKARGFTAQPGGSQGNLCLGGSIGRYVGPGQTQMVGPTGEMSLPVDLTQVPQPSGFESVAPGETWRFQAWYRDQVAGSPTSNFTEGLEVLFE